MVQERLYLLECEEEDDTDEGLEENEDEYSDQDIQELEDSMDASTSDEEWEDQRKNFMMED